MTGRSDRSLWQSTKRADPTFRRLAYQSPRIPDDAGTSSRSFDRSRNRRTTRSVHLKITMKELVSHAPLGKTPDPFFSSSTAPNLGSVWLCANALRSSCQLLLLYQSNAPNPISFFTTEQDGCGAPFPRGDGPGEENWDIQGQHDYHYRRCLSNMAKRWRGQAFRRPVPAHTI